MAVLRLVVGFFRVALLNLEGVALAGRTEVKPGFRIGQAPNAPHRNAELQLVADSGQATPLDQPERLNTLLERYIRE
jgi:hypothetical protein